MLISLWQRKLKGQRSSKSSSVFVRLFVSNLSKTPDSSLINAIAFLGDRNLLLRTHDLGGIWELGKAAGLILDFIQEESVGGCGGSRFLSVPEIQNFLKVL